MAAPEVAVTVRLYVPAGVPDVVEFELLEPYPGRNTNSKRNAKTSAVHSKRRRDFFPPIPKPSSANPETGNNAA